MGTPAPVIPPVFSEHWYSKILHFFRHIQVFVSDAFIKLFGADAAHSFAVGAESLLKTDLGKIVWTAVQEVQNLASGSEKQAAAYAKVLGEAQKLGLEVKTSLLNLLIEVAVGRLKNYFGSGPTP